MAKLVDVGSIASHFESLPDPRHERNRKHLLADIIVICIAGILCGCDGPTAIRRWAKEREDWLRSHLKLPNGVPSRDCLRQVLMRVQPEAFQAGFAAWLAAALAPDPNRGKRRLVAIDGKTCRGSHDAAKGLGALHHVSAWASEEGLALGQVACAEKSNEITAIPELLRQIELKDTIVTIDAMGCQKEIVQQIAAGHGDAVIAVKDNQPKLKAAIAEFFDQAVERDFEDLQFRRYEEAETGHGREEERAYYACKIPADFAPAKDWPWVKAIGYALRTTKRPDGEIACEIRYYILTRYLSGKRFAEAVRGHWSIESMHWVLDVTFREDESRTRARTLGNNLSWLRRFAVSLLKRHPDKDSIRGKMNRCAYNTAFLQEVLEFQGI